MPHGSDGHSEEHGGAPEVGGDEERGAAKTVGPGSGEEPEEEDGQGGGAAKNAHLERGGAEDHDGHERKSRAGDTRADLRDGLEIGRASCRERGEISEVAVSLKEKKAEERTVR